MSSGMGKSHLAFMPFGFWFLGIILPSFWGTLATWILIPGITLPFFSFEVWLLAGEVLVWFGLVCLFWVHRHLVQTAGVNMGIAHSKVPHSIWEPLGEKRFFLTCQSIAMIQWQEKWPKNIRSLLTLDRKMDQSFPYVQDFLLYLFKKSCLEEITSPIPLYRKHHYEQS